MCGDWDEGCIIGLLIIVVVLVLIDGLLMLLCDALMRQAR